METTTKFQPTESQEIILKAFQAENYLCTVEKACSVIDGLARSTYYDWFDHPDFTEWWQEQADEFFAKRLPKVKGAMLAGAIEHAGKGDKKYNPKAQELFLQRFDKGFVPRSKKEVEHSGQIGVNLSRLTDEQLKAMEQSLQDDDRQDDTTGADAGEIGAGASG